MSTTTIPISEASHQILHKLAEQTGQSTMEVLDKSLDAYRRKLFFEKLNADYAELRADPEQWAQFVAERDLWNAPLMDGLDPAEQWTEDGFCVQPEESVEVISNSHNSPWLL